MIRTTTRIALVFLVALGLSACREDAQSQTSQKGFSDMTEGCAKSVVTPLIGEPRSALSRVPLPDPVRVIPVGGMVTHDFRPDRTNIDLDEDERIVRVWCG
ncbi:I78 family peptidase inhibitor [Celeribacter sp.]|uniref:I78 family peptidase inhibitor n=1 Tax=Celeribacter sp. TaxID=1890673 RepID=UPI003A94A0A9